MAPTMTGPVVEETWEGPRGAHHFRGQMYRNSGGKTITTIAAHAAYTGR
jgi:hypothetical protein